MSLAASQIRRSRPRLKSIKESIANLGSKSKYVVWFSSPESIKKKQVSLFACVEIACSVIVFWSIWYWLDTRVHLLATLIITPMLLLRSPQSIRKAVEWFGRPEVIPLAGKVGISLVLTMAVLSFSLGWVVANAWLPGHAGFALVWRSMVVGALAGTIGVAGIGAGTLIGAVAVAGGVAGAFAVVLAVAVTGASAVAGVGTAAIVSISAVAGAIAGTIAVVVATAGTAGATGKGTKYFIFSVLAIPLELGFWIGTVFVRVISTLTHLPEGVRYIPGNWRKIMFQIDPRQPPILIPGHKHTSLPSLMNSRSGTLDARVFQILLILFVLIPALLYRWSIKSTLWFYWPILYSRGGRLRHIHIRKFFSHTRLKQFLVAFFLLLAISISLLLAYITISGDTFDDIRRTDLAVIFPYLLATATTAAAAIETAVDNIVNFDFYTMTTWNWIQLVIALLIPLLLFIGWTVFSNNRAAKKYGVKYRGGPFRAMRAHKRFRKLIIWGCLLVGIALTAMYWKEIYPYLPASWIAWLEVFIETNLPDLFAG